MKILLLVLLCIVCSNNYCQAQEQTAKILIETAKTLVQNGDFENAVLLLDRAKQQAPDNIDLLRDLTFAYYLKRDFAKAIETGKELIEKPNSDQQSFQVLGLAYKAIAAYKDCGKMYRVALRKFPSSGLIYCEYAELFAIQHEFEEAITLWEKGIELDPLYSGNYYHATQYYFQKKSWLRASIYGELFVNLESYSARTTEISSQLFDSYTSLFTTSAIFVLLQERSTSAFEIILLTQLAKLLSDHNRIATFDNFILLRSRFISAWFAGNPQIYPFRLFDHHQYLLNQQLFEAYHYWLFSEKINQESQLEWAKNHPKERADFIKFQQSRVFKIPVGQYYFNK